MILVIFNYTFPPNKKDLRNNSLNLKYIYRNVYVSVIFFNKLTYLHGPSLMTNTIQIYKQSGRKRRQQLAQKKILKVMIYQSVMLFIKLLSPNIQNITVTTAGSLSEVRLEDILFQWVSNGAIHGVRRTADRCRVGGLTHVATDP